LVRAGITRHGLTHAEVNALQAAGEFASGATMYVTLEPCTHHGRTPPCTEAIIDAGITMVVYAVADPNPAATGGATLLEAAGVEVIHGILESQARQMNRFYLHFQAQKQPYIVAKYAASLDGRIATRTGHSQWITGPQARRRGHELRQAVDAIIVGSQTVIDDDPALTVRLDELTESQVRHPLRVVMDSSGRIPLDRKIFDPQQPGQTLVFTTDRMPAEHEQALIDRNITVLRVDGDKRQRVSIDAMLSDLADMQIQSAMIEGGQALLGSFLDASAVHEVWAFLAPILIGGVEAKHAIGGAGVDRLEHAARLANCSTEKLGNDWLMCGQLFYLRKS